MTNLRELLAGDLSKAPEDALIAGIKDAELTFDAVQVWAGRLIAELRRRADPPPSWADLSRRTGVPSTTLRNRVAKAEEDA